MKALVRQSSSLGEVIKIRAHPHSIPPELKALSQAIGVDVRHVKGVPFELELLMGLRGLPRKISTIASTAAFSWMLIFETSEHPEVHVYWPWFSRVGEASDEVDENMETVFLRLGELYEGKFFLHDSLPS